MMMDDVVNHLSLNLFKLLVQHHHCSLNYCFAGVMLVLICQCVLILKQINSCKLHQSTQSVIAGRPGSYCYDQNARAESHKRTRRRLQLQCYCNGSSTCTVQIVFVTGAFVFSAPM